jgi:hypothetical protein
MVRLLEIVRGSRFSRIILCGQNAEFKPPQFDQARFMLCGTLLAQWCVAENEIIATIEIHDPTRHYKMASCAPACIRLGWTLCGIAPANMTLSIAPKE